jgi:hypothetical protein
LTHDLTGIVENCIKESFLKRRNFSGEAQFDRVFRPSSVADKKRIAYLFSDGAQKAMLDRYRDVLSSPIDLAGERGSRVILVKMPVPERFFGLMPDEAAFDAAINDLASAHGVAFHDFSGSLDDPQHYSDTDHLNRDGLTLRKMVSSLRLPDGKSKPRARRRRSPKKKTVSTVVLEPTGFSRWSFSVFFKESLEPLLRSMEDSR